MQIQTTVTPELANVVLVGELDIYAVNEVNAVLRSVLLESEHVEVDLARVDTVDGAGLQALMAAKLEALRTARVLTLNRHSKALIEAIELTQVQVFFGDPVVLRAEELRHE